ncbi:MAG: aminoacyl-tRNA hydrolase [Chitinophagaceae bacterium]
MEKFLIVGLGNIGSEYANTRHNIGFDVLNAFASKHGAGFRIDRLAEVIEVKLKGRTLVCIKPTTYMNLSGKAFKYWLDKEKIDLKNTLTIVDDLALPIEKIRIRPSGSDAGHNGLKDIQATLQTTDYPKLRFGIGNVYPKGRQVDFVLGKWRDEEWPLIRQKVDACTELIENFVLAGIDRTMNVANQMKFVL